MSNNTDDLRRLRAAFLKEHFGEPQLVLPPLPAGPLAIAVNVYAPDPPTRDYYTLVTDGLSELLLDQPHASSDWACERAELILYLPSQLVLTAGQTDLPGPINYLRMLAEAPAASDLRPQAFVVLPNGMPARSFIDDSALTHGIFLPPSEEPTEIRDGFDAPDGTSVEFLWLDFVTTAEVAYLQAHGPAPFLAMLGASGHLPPTRMDRPTYVTIAHGDSSGDARDAAPNRIRQMQTQALQDPDGNAVDALLVAVDVHDPETADGFVATLVDAVAQHGAKAPSRLLLVTMMGRVAAPDFAALWKKHASAHPTMPAVMAGMQKAAAVHGTPDGRILGESSLLPG